jgi:hypothetical protein
MNYWVSGVAVTLVALWALWQGYRVMQGQARNAMELVWTVPGPRSSPLWH